MTPKEFRRSLEKIDSRLDSIDRTLIKQESNLEQHMARTEANEKMLAILKDEIKPILTHIEAIKISIKTILGLGAISAAILGIVELVKFFS